MAAKLRTGLEILVILLLASCIICGIYGYAAEHINAYYEPAENDIFATSMDVKGIFSTEDGNVLVTGTFLQEDNVMNDTSVFVKSYKEDGSVNGISSIDIPNGFAVKSQKMSKNRLFVLEESVEKKADTAYLYVILSDGALDFKREIKIEKNANDTASFFAFWDDEKLYSAVLKNGVNLIIFDENGNEKITVDLSLDFELSGISVVDGTFYLTGAKFEDTKSFGYVEAFDSEGKLLFSTAAMKDDISECSCVFKNDDKIYVLGKFFDGRAYASVKYPEKKYEECVDEIAQIARNSLASQEFLFGEVLLKSNFESSPWSNYFLIKLDENGKYENAVAPFTISADFGISEFNTFSDGKNLGYGIFKMADAIYSESYNARVHFIDGNLSAGKSADINVPKNEAMYLTADKDGKIICYTGLSRKDGTKLLSIKTFKDTNELAKEQKKLVILEKILSYFKFITDSELIFGVAVILILYATARMSGKREDEKAI